MLFIGSRLSSLSLSALWRCYLRQESYEVVPQVRICVEFVPACLYYTIIRLDLVYGQHDHKIQGVHRLIFVHCITDICKKKSCQ